MTIQQSRRTFIKIAAGTGVGLIIGRRDPADFGKSGDPAVRAQPIRARRA